MITLPPNLAPNAAAPTLLDFGRTLVPPLGGEELRVDRLGNRFMIEVSWPAMRVAEANVIINRLMRAKSEGLRIPFPLFDAPQGNPGAVVVDGAGQAGTTIDLRNFNPGYTAREGYWLSIENAAGQHYLHNVAGTLRIGDDGLAALPIWPMLRTDFADGAAVHLAKPMIEGLPVGDETSWVLPRGRLVELSVTIRETA